MALSICMMFLTSGEEKLALEKRAVKLGEFV